MAFTKQHYEELASIISAYKSVCNAEQIETINGMVNELSDCFMRDNPRFDRQKFVKACE